MRQRLQGVERQLAQVFREFPVSYRRDPATVRATGTENGKGHEWPILVSEPEGRWMGGRVRWTPERRREQAERMKRQHGKLKKLTRHTGLVVKVHRYLAKHGSRRSKS